MRSWVAAIAVMCATCGASERAKPDSPGRGEPALPQPAAFPSGVFAITAARVVSDSCGNRLRFATKTLDIDPAAASVHSDPEDRAYEAVIDGRSLVARGAFSKNSLCQTYKHLEIWRLERESEDEISGSRTTFWRDPSRSGSADCLEACKVVYAVEAVRADPAELQAEPEE